MPIDGKSIDIGTAVITTTTHNESVIDIVKFKEMSKNELDLLATSIRRKYITPTMDDIYREKADQAIEYVAAGYPANVSAYPFIRAEANATGLTTSQAADSIISARQAWMSKMADIEEQRRKGKVLIDSATTISDVDAAKDAAIVALNLL